MNTATRTFAIALAALALAIGSMPASAQARHGGQWGGHAWHGHGHDGHGHGHWGPGPFWGGVGIGFGLGFYGPWYPGYVVVEPPPAVYYGTPTEPFSPATKPAPDPIFYPRNDQSPAQVEADRQDCNRWATTQANAMADASVFHRATLACMEGRGYTVR
jgi:hypothetical protein